MTPEYLRELADLADPDQLWRLSGLAQMELPAHKRQRLDMGVALRRHADHVQQMLEALAERRSLLLIPLSPNSSAQRRVDTPADYRDRQRERAGGGT